MGKVNDENVRTGQQETNEPWKKPDKSDHHPDKESPNPPALDVPRTITRRNCRLTVAGSSKMVWRPLPTRAPTPIE
jgi:hypothetical protein